MSTKLGTLTLDLVAKVTNFTDGIKTAEKKVTQSFEQMKEVAKTYGSAVVLAAGTATAAIGSMAITYANTAAEIQNFSAISMASTTEFQRQAAGAKTVGVTLDQLANQYKDFNEKLGEFLTIGSGGAVDFFEQIAIKTEGSAEGARKLAIEMQKLSGPQAMQLYVDKLEEAGVSQQQMSFYLESMASDTTKLIPLLRNGGEGFEFWADAAERAGAILDEHAIKKAAELKVQMNLLELQVEGAKNQFIQGLVPALTSVGSAMSFASNETDLMSEAGETLGNVFKGVGAVALGVYASVKMLTNAIAGLAVDAVKAKNIVDTASESGSIFNQLPGVKAVRTLLTGSILAQAPDSGVQMAAQDNKKVAEDIAKSIDTIFNGSVDNGIKKMAELGSVQAGVIAGSDEWIKKQKEAAEAEQKAAEAAKLKYKYRQDELVQLQKVAKISAENNLNEIGAEYGVPKNMLAALMMQESKGDRNAVSATGAIGYFQTTSRYRQDNKISIEDSKNLPVIARVVAKNLSKAYEELGSWEAAIRSHNAGLEGSRQFEKNGRVNGSAARNKEVAEFAPSVDKWFAALNGGSGFLGEGADTKGTQEYLNYLETLERERKQIRDKYAIEFADDDWKRRIDYNNQVAELNFAFQGEELQQYLAVANTRYAEAQKLADMQFAWEVTEHRLTEEQKLRYSQNIKEQEIRASTQLTNEQKKQKLEVLKQQFNQEFTMFKLAQEKQLLEMKRNWMTVGEYARQYYALVRQEILNTPSYSPELKQAMVKDANFNQGLEENSEREQIWGDYQSRFGEQDSPYENDLKLLQAARKEGLVIEEEYFARKAELEASAAMASTAQLGDALTSMLDKSSGAYAVALGMQKSFSIYSSLMAAKTAYAQAFADPSAMSVPQKILGAMAVAAPIASALGELMSINTSITGMAHDGIDNVPKEGTWLLDKGERVVDSRTNADLKGYLQDARSQTSSPNITINVPPGYTAQQSQSNDGITIDIVDRLTAQNLANPNSETNKAYRRQYATSWR